MNDSIKSMKLNHLSFPSADTAATAQFFERYLGFTISGTWDKCYILKRPGYDVVIDHHDDVPAWPRAFHVGFELPTFDAVQELFDRFTQEQVEMEAGIFNNGRGSRFFCRAPGGVMFELNTRSDASPEFRSTFDA
ncbi:Lactoylglutathione lyase and related lyase [Candidatus Burkholderia verschuerenii]|uniref:Lactoylglutathione lyase and related lyase n=1 Tax=Candidatus Burkholderia verschuerenii TaxID=242163 RepID=A0A0L0MFR7_9BURK|nr:VOC family protein [Candidatus Burkholderia verschuerenii]KND61115.1 Lactoylglutathione lyase and related lyase [Candidatus Burkholderia verschuerenii]